ncbi:MAG TPA: hypothetical protein VHD56_11645 [Tepidisphaeraceae bacterium]|nr:hypothetical protein [Tepidisphaeraceae bacterium]
MDLVPFLVDRDNSVFNMEAEFKPFSFHFHPGSFRIGSKLRASIFPSELKRDASSKRKFRQVILDDFAKKVIASVTLVITDERLVAEEFRDGVSFLAKGRLQGIPAAESAFTRISDAEVLLSSSCKFVRDGEFVAPLQDHHTASREPVGDGMAITASPLLPEVVRDGPNCFIRDIAHRVSPCSKSNFRTSIPEPRVEAFLAPYICRLRPSSSGLAP